MKPYVNPNPRLGVFLQSNDASVRLRNCLLRPACEFMGVTSGGCRKRGLKRFTRDWPCWRLLKLWPQFGGEAVLEFHSMLLREHPEMAEAWMKGAKL